MHLLENNQEDSQKLIATVTGELYQPGRIYYKVFNKKSLLKILQKLNCIQFNSEENIWGWMYNYEAKKLRFKISYYQIPKEYRPIILGYLSFRGEDLMLLEVRSLTRLVHAVEFFGKRINPHIAKATHLRLVNKLFNNTEDNRKIHRSFDFLFDRELSQPSYEERLKQIKIIAEKYSDMEEKIEALSEYLKQIANDKLPEIEELAIDYYTDGIEGLKFNLHIRQIQVLEHFNGNTEFNYLDILTEMLSEELDYDELQ